VGASPAITVDCQSLLVSRFNELLAAYRLDFDSSHDGIADRVERNDNGSQSLADGAGRPLNILCGPPKALPADKE